MAEQNKSRKAHMFRTVLLLLLLVALAIVFATRKFDRSTAAATVREQRVVHTINLRTGTGAPDFKEGSVFFIGNATVLIRYAGFTILTDPNFLHAGDHVHLGYGLKAKRLTNPAMELKDLPPVDLVVLSHMHGDHFDQVVEAKLDRSLSIVTTRQAVTRLKDLGFKAPAGLQTWESAEVNKGNASLVLTALPGRHGPGPVSAALPEVQGTMLEFKKADGSIPCRIYISGDTLVHDDLKKIPQQYPDINLGLFHLGGTRILGLTVTMDAKQGVKALQIIAPDLAIPIHYNDYDRFKSPLSDFQKAVKEAGLEGKVRYLRHGETYMFHPAQS